MSIKTITIKVIPNSKLNKVVEEKKNFLKVKLTARAVEGKANKALLDFLSQYYKIAKSKIVIVSGLKSRVKRINLNF